MANNRGVVYAGPGKVEVQSIDFPKLSLGSRKCEHGVILKLISTNICGSAIKETLHGIHVHSFGNAILRRGPDSPQVTRGVQSLI